LVGSRLLKVDGRWEAVGEVRHLIAGRLTDLTALLEGINVRSRDFH
jgi:error-prone DNA polymerase